MAPYGAFFLEKWMISYRTGDVVKAFVMGEVRTLIHQANCQNTMGSGIAKQVKQHLRDLYNADQRTVKGDMRKLGQCSYAIVQVDAPTDPHKRYIPDGVTLLGINLYGQYAYGLDTRHTNYEAVGAGLATARALIDAYDLDDMPIGMPKIGCGLGGGDWEIVSRLIEKHLGDLNVVVYNLA